MNDINRLFSDRDNNISYPMLPPFVLPLRAEVMSSPGSAVGGPKNRAVGRGARAVAVDVYPATAVLIGARVSSARRPRRNAR